MMIAAKEFSRVTDPNNSALWYRHMDDSTAQRFSYGKIN
jgi:hypothetical protein